jgi:hypothetical protein
MASAAAMLAQWIAQFCQPRRLWRLLLTAFRSENGFLQFAVTGLQVFA